MQLRIPYGKTSLTAHLPDQHPVDIIEAPQTPPAPQPLALVQQALDHPLGSFRWQDFIRARSAAIAINDKTRPVPHDILLPPLLEHLASLGILEQEITFFIANGSHPPMTPAEYAAVLPPALQGRRRVISHDSEDIGAMVDLGATRRGTPVWCNRAYREAELKIVVGNIEPHQFAGFSGGVKSAAIGLAALPTINSNHALLAHPDSQMGEYDTNPARQDIEEIGQKIGVHLAVNAILNQSKQIVHVLAGEPRAVMSAGLEPSRAVCQVAVGQRYGLVISSPGGHPKDLNVYQAQKGLAHAARITRPGGTVILAAACPEGSGSLHYEEWALGKRSYAETLEAFAAEGFRIGPHKAFQIARDASRLRLMWISEMETSLARALLLNPAPDLQTALDLALADLPVGERIAILPHAASTIPNVSSPTPSHE